ncbi:CLUMA_CG001259, isoform A [Clunio marinus]|uniref:CLUMA_CG001259, isoform A n=1 Tax=Clunio marinus TaxID=568069 RepID=A0A1J1HIS4_9DIPT|nr:CLUMA_CG001259, isoform A [Clunio marinus]
MPKIPSVDKEHLLSCANKIAFNTKISSVVRSFFTRVFARAKKLFVQKYSLIKLTDTALDVLHPFCHRLLFLTGIKTSSKDCLYCTCRTGKALSGRILLATIVFVCLAIFLVLCKQDLSPFKKNNQVVTNFGMKNTKKLPQKVHNEIFVSH